MTRNFRPSILVLLVLMAAAAPARAAGPTGEIGVTGTGRVAVTPDTALVQLGAEARAQAMGDATAEVARRMHAVLAAVKGQGVAEPDVTTLQYAVEPRIAARRTEDDPARVTAYVVTSVVQVRVRRVGDAGRVLDAAVAAGANVIRGIQFTLADPSAAEAQARALAVRSAADKARQIAQAAGVRLGEILSITEGVGPRPVMSSLARAATFAAAVAPGPVEPGQLEISVTVEVRYRLAP